MGPQLALSDACFVTTTRIVINASPQHQPSPLLCLSDTDVPPGDLRDVHVYRCVPGQTPKLTLVRFALPLRSDIRSLDVNAVNGRRHAA